MLSYLKHDTWRIHGRYAHYLLIRSLLTDRAFRTIATHRLCQHILNRRGPWLVMYPVSRVLHRWTQGAIGFELPLTTAVGPGLRVQHGWTLIVNDTASIGRNVTLLHNVTIGSTRKGAPIIEDEVTLAAGAIVIGPVTVGRGAIVAAGAVVTRDVPPGCIVAGNPARVLKTTHALAPFNPAAV